MKRSALFLVSALAASWLCAAPSPAPPMLPGGSSAGSAAPAIVPVKAVAHPFLLWTKDEAAGIKARIDTAPWAKQTYARMLAGQGSGCETLDNLFRYAVMGDKAAGAMEKARLLALADANVQSREARRPYTDLTFQALRYDTLYDLLTDGERKTIEAHLGKWADDTSNFDRIAYSRLTWTPNMEWPRRLSGMLVAVALEDTQRINGFFSGRGGIKYFLDDYLADGRFTMEDFSRLQPTVGELLLWCRGVERLGMNGLGYGYQGKTGATVQRLLTSYFDLGYPRVELGTARPAYPMVAMGARKSDGSPMSYLLQQSLVRGYLPDGSGGDGRFTANPLNGRDETGRVVEKLDLPLIFELASQKWPDAGFSYLLAQMRGPQEDRYYPSLYFGLEPIDPAAVTPPPALSWVARERGLALLRAEQGAGYWASPAPAVALQFATDYKGAVPDYFSLLGFYAYNRPIYLNRQCVDMNAGFDKAWSASSRGCSGVLVNGNDIRPTGATTVREDLNSPARFVSATTLGANFDVLGSPISQSRALFLTREYLLDISRFNSRFDNDYYWTVHALGQPVYDDPTAWKASDALATGFAPLQGERSCAAMRGEQVKPQRPGEQARTLYHDTPWSLTVMQQAPANVAAPRLGADWYRRQVGVRISMLPDLQSMPRPTTTVYVADTPAIRRSQDGATVSNEFGGVTVVCKRRMGATAFVALHEPFADGKWRINDFRRLQVDEQGVAVAIIGEAGSGINDRVLYSYAGDEGRVIEREATDPAHAESYRYTDHAYLRISADKVEAWGQLQAATIRVQGTPKFLLNGTEQPITIRDGMLIFAK